MKKTELLAPAGDFESLKQAVFGGANAVYFGAKNFNARTKANNFGEDMAKAVAFCHTYGVKAYLTLNVLLENDQIDELILTVKNAVSCCVDAFIVQDFGVLHILKNNFKNIEIHASTQMAINNYKGAIMAERMGIKRVVLARETSIEDIKLIKEKTNLEIEYFIQGALCVCVSGNCYLSSHLFGKSGNKGECIQPCRLPYKAFYEGKLIKKGYLLSAKDLCMANRLKELSDAGVDSFKIEGRLRRPAYVSAVVKTYRKIIDNNYKVSEKDINDLKMAFNRGDFTEGYFNGNNNIIDNQIQGHKGIMIGSVINFQKGTKFNIITLKSSYKIGRGDVIKFIDNGLEVCVITAIDISNQNDIYKITTTQSVPINSKANLILNSSKEQLDMELIKRLPLSFTLYAYVGEKIKLEYQFKNISGVVQGNVCEKAKSQSLTKEEAYSQLSKLKDTYFILNKFNFNSNGVFVSKKELNNLRRVVVSQIEDYYKPKTQIEYNSYVDDKIEIEFLYDKCNFKFIKIADSEKTNADILVLKPKNYLAYDFSKLNHNNVYLYIPSFLSHNDIEVIDNILAKNKNLGVYAENLGALCYNRKTILGAKLNIKNRLAIKELANENIVAVVLSPENSERNLSFFKNIDNLPLFTSNFQGFDLMTLVHCPIKNIYNCNCDKCLFKDGITYQMEGGHILNLTRYRVHNCYFNLSKFVDNTDSILYTRLQER